MKTLYNFANIRFFSSLFKKCTKTNKQMETAVSTNVNEFVPALNKPPIKKIVSIMFPNGEINFVRKLIPGKRTKHQFFFHSYHGNSKIKQSPEISYSSLSGVCCISRLLSRLSNPMRLCEIHFCVRTLDRRRSRPRRCVVTRTQINIKRPRASTGR